MNFLKFDTDKWILICDTQKVYSEIFLHKEGQLHYAINSGRTFIDFDTEAEMNEYIETNNLLPAYKDGTWDFETKYRVQITYAEALLDNDLSDLVLYAKSEPEIKTKEYNDFVYVYVNWFLRSHYEILKNKIEVKDGGDVSPDDIFDGIS